VAPSSSSIRKRFISSVSSSSQDPPKPSRPQRFKQFMVSGAAVGTIGLLAAAPLRPVEAATTVQTFTLPYTFTGFTESSSSQFIGTPSPTQFSNVQPFNSSLGNFIKATIVWAVNQTFTGTVGKALGGGDFGMSNGGGVGVNSFGYSSFGLGGGNGGSSGQTISASANGGLTTAFLPTNPSQASILSVLLGTSPYTLSWTAGMTGSYLNISSGTANFSTTATVTYEYSEPVPGPLPFMGAGAAFGWSRRLRRRLKLAG
jgi:hypothetical protein